MLIVHEVSKTFSSSGRSEAVTALRNINFEVPEGQFVALVGPSGCGKSTLLNLVAGIDTPSAGMVSVAGVPVSGPGRERGVMFQQYHLFPWMSVRENIEFGPRSRAVSRPESRHIAQKYVDMVGLSGFEHRYPHELSGGMQQRCALARMLANDPLILLMDEPLAAVDAQTRSILQEELLLIWGEESLPQNRKTIIFVTHGIEEAVYLADRVIVMGRKPGRVIADLENPLPRPRVNARRAAAFGEVVESIWSLLHDQAAEAARQ